MRDCCVSVLPVNAPLNQGTVFSSDRSVNRSLFGKETFRNSQVGAMDFPQPKIPFEDGGAYLVFGYDQQTGGVPVQAVDAAENIGDSLFLKIQGDSVGKRIGRMADGGVDGHAGGLADNQKVAVLKDNVKRYGSRDDIFGGGFIADRYPEDVSFLQEPGHSYRSSVFHNRCRVRLHGEKNMPGIAESPEKFMNRFSAVILRYLVRQNAFHSFLIPF